MQNAPENVRAAADRIAPPNTEDGVLQVLEELLDLG
jgi:hydroxymethylpyrimidine pyrophosphatase-like HAD family hydrolase